MAEYSIIVACTLNGGIGYNNKIPWNIKEDLRNFQRITLTTKDPSQINAVIMGKNTWFSLPENKRPLHGRINIVITKSINNIDYPGIIIARSLEHAHSIVKKYNFIDKIFVIGGAKLYREAMFDYHYNKVYLTYIHKDFDCDTFIDLSLLRQRYKLIKEGHTKISDDDKIEFSYNEYEQSDILI